MSEIVFISSALQQPRHQKRIDMLREAYSIDVYYFYRNKYLENYKGYEESATKLGEIKDGSTFTRIFLLIKLLFILLFHKAKIVYCTSPDQALVAILAFKKVIFEVGDLYQIDGGNRIYQTLDKFILPRISGLVITSPYFYDGYFKKYEKELIGKVVVIENKLVPKLNDCIDSYRNYFEFGLHEKKIKLGIIGSLVFKKPLELVSQYLQNSSNSELHIYGDGLYSIFKDNPNSFYHGRFKSPEDLSNIYKNIDINIILYDYDNNNVKLALPNKLYESIAYLKPIICAADVALSNYVINHKIGVVVKNDDIQTAVDEIIENYAFYIQNLRSMPKKSYLCYEQQDILKLINSIKV